MKHAGRSGTHRVMTPIELLARLAALVPPPRYPLVRYQGITDVTATTITITQTDWCKKITFNPSLGVDLRYEVNNGEQAATGNQQLASAQLLLH